MQSNNQKPALWRPPAVPRALYRKIGYKALNTNKSVKATVIAAFESFTTDVKVTDLV